MAESGNFSYTSYGKILSWVPAVVLVASIIAALAVAQFQISEHSDSIDVNRKAIAEQNNQINEIQQLILRQQGNQQVAIQELRGDIKLILRLLKEQDAPR